MLVWLTDTPTDTAKSSKCGIQFFGNLDQISRHNNCIKKKLHIAVLHTWDRRYSRFQDRWAHSWAEPGAKAIKWPGILWRTIRLLKPPLKFINNYQGIQKTLTKRNLVDNEGAGFCILYIQVTLLHDVRPHRHLFKIQMSNRRKAKTNFKQLRCLIDPSP